jgi:hypothetical protein
MVFLCFFIINIIILFCLARAHGGRASARESGARVPRLWHHRSNSGAIDQSCHSGPSL